MKEEEERIGRMDHRSCPISEHYKIQKFPAVQKLQEGNTLSKTNILDQKGFTTARFDTAIGIVVEAWTCVAGLSFT